MGYKRKYRKWKKRARGKYARKGRRSFSARVKKVLMKNIETKYFDGGIENQQLYHNTGTNGYSHVGLIIWNPWALICQGSGLNQRVGDSIQPRGMKLRLWMSNKLDRPNVMYRVIVAIMPRLYNGAAVTAGSIDIAPALSSGTLGNYMCLPIDTQKGIKVLKDKIYAFHSGWGDNSNATQKEFSNFRQYWIKRKKSRPIKYDYLGNILNNYVAVYVIPYDAYGSLTTDNIASCACLTRMYWKDP